MVKRALAKPGGDIKAAGLRRRIPKALMAERAFIARSTLQKVEQGNPAVSMGIYLTVVFILGMSDRVDELAEPTLDGLGMQLEGGTAAKADPAQQGNAALIDCELLVYANLVGRLGTRRSLGYDGTSFEFVPVTFRSTDRCVPVSQKKPRRVAGLEGQQALDRSNEDGPQVVSVVHQFGGIINTLRQGDRNREKLGHAFV